LKKLNEFDPDDANIHYNLAQTYLVLHDFGEALRWAEEGRALVTHDESARAEFDELVARIKAAEIAPLGQSL
jgi:hypothetical protein